MIFELLTPQFLKMTADLTNAVLVAALPIMNDTAKRLELDVPIPISSKTISGIQPQPMAAPNFAGASFRLTNEVFFSVQNGIVTDFESPRSPWFSDQVYLRVTSEKPNSNHIHTTAEQIISLGRSSLTKLGYKENQLYAVNGPSIESRIPADTNLPPRFSRLNWESLTGGPSVRMDLDCQRMKLVGFHFFSHRQLPPNTNWLSLPTARTNWNPIWASVDPKNNPAYAKALVPFVFAAIDDYSRKMNLPVPSPLTTNHVARFEFNDNNGWPHVEVFLTNRWHFIFRNSSVSGFKSPNCFWDGEPRPLSISDFAGQWRFSEADSLTLAKQAVKKAGYPANSLHLDEAPKITKPFGASGNRVPRYFIEWRHYPVKDEEFTAWTRVEVNADKGLIESVFHDAKILWGKNPPIDLPLSFSADTGR